MPNALDKLKRVVIKEEFVALTGDFIKAVLLNQFIYWSERVKDFDQFITEELARAGQVEEKINMQLTNGWIYKKAEQLSEETMLGMAPNSILRHIKVLVERGWLDERHNPDQKWDRVKQYRVNLLLIASDLMEKGYALEGYKIPFSILENAISKMDFAKSKIEYASSNMENEKSNIDVSKSNLENAISILDNPSSNMDVRNIKNGRAIPEITTDNVVVVEALQKESKQVDAQEIDTFIKKLKEATGYIAEEKFAQDILIAWPYEYVLEKIEVARSSRITESVAGFLINACEKDWKKNTGKIPGEKIKKRQRNKEKESWLSPDEEKRKEMIRSLYRN